MILVKVGEIKVYNYWLESNGEVNGSDLPVRTDFVQNDADNLSEEHKSPGKKLYK